MVRAVLSDLIIFALLFIAELEFADGRHARITQKAVIKARNTIGL